jgi:proteasome beta subunit
VSMPFFSPSDDPGPSFPALLRRCGLVPPDPLSLTGGDHGGSFSGALAIPHATTCVALRYDGGVVMAGDRRATSGNLISHRGMEKVVQSDRLSGVAIAGAAGPAMAMIKVFQLQLEHYEKVEGKSLSLEGKANQLSLMVRDHLPAAMQGLAVVPIFAGFDERRSTGRLWAFDVTGGRYEEQDYVATGSGMLHAGTVVKLGYRTGLSADEAVDLACLALWEAADADSATGGPDALRGIYPVVANIGSKGWHRIDDDDLTARYERIAAGVRR